MASLHTKQKRPEFLTWFTQSGTVLGAVPGLCPALRLHSPLLVSLEESVPLSLSLAWAVPSARTALLSSLPHGAQIISEHPDALCSEALKRDFWCPTTFPHNALYFSIITTIAITIT